MSFNRNFKLILWCSLILLSFGEPASKYNEEGSGIEADFLPVNFENIFRHELKINTMSLNTNQLKEINFLINANMEILKEEMKLLIKSEMNARNENELDIKAIKCSDNSLPKSCYEVNQCHTHIYSIMLPNYTTPSPVVCDLKTLNGGWTIIQRRQDGSENFYRNWTEYVEGFGSMNGEFFIGLEKLHLLTTNGKKQELYIMLEDFEGTKKYARYKNINIESESKGYKLNIGEYSGNVGDSMKKHNGAAFSTIDHGDGINCALQYKGGWWYNNCHSSNLNGLYLYGQIPKSKSGQGVSWSSFRGHLYSLKFVQMMIRDEDADD